MLSIIFQADGTKDWWNPNQTSLPPPSGGQAPLGALKNDLPIGVYLYKKLN